jgi:hypothetical protein
MFLSAPQIDAPPQQSPSASAGTGYSRNTFDMKHKTNIPDLR